MSKGMLASIFGGVIATAAASSGASYYLAHSTPSAEDVRAAATAEAHERYLREREPHVATLFSYIQPARDAGDAAQPVMVTIEVAGSDGLGALCSDLPRAQEAVLRALSGGGFDIRAADLGRLEGSIRAALNAVLKGGPVQSVRTTPMVDSAAGGRAAYQTAKMCEAVLKS